MGRLPNGSEGLNQAVLDVPTSVRERQERLDATLIAIRTISDLAGKELPIDNTTSLDEVSSEPGVHVFMGHINVGPGEQITDTTFDFQPVLLSGIADSAHSVVSGTQTVKFRGGREESIDVAAKCYAKRTPEERFGRALKEAMIMEELGAFGALTMEPIALAIAPNTPSSRTSGEVVLLTRYNAGLLSMDNLPWGRGVSNRENAAAAVQAVQALGIFNAVFGYRHGDAKIKNVAVEEDGRIGMIDYETSDQFDATNPVEAAITASDDFGMFIDSLEKKGFIKRDGYREHRQMINTLGEAYVEMWGETPTEVQDAVLTEVTRIVGYFDPARTADLVGA